MQVSFLVFNFAFKSVTRWCISYVFWCKSPYLWALVCNSFGAKFNGFLTVVIQELKISQVVWSLNKEKSFIIGRDYPLTKALRKAATWCDNMKHHIIVVQDTNVSYIPLKKVFKKTFWNYCSISIKQQY